MENLYLAFKIACAYNKTTMTRWAMTNNILPSLVSVIANERKKSRRVTQLITKYIQNTEHKFGICLLPQSNHAEKNT